MVALSLEMLDLQHIIDKLFDGFVTIWWLDDL